MRHSASARETVQVWMSTNLNFLLLVSSFFTAIISCRTKEKSSNAISVIFCTSRRSSPDVTSQGMGVPRLIFSASHVYFVVARNIRNTVSSAVACHDYIWQAIAQLNFVTPVKINMIQHDQRVYHFFCKTKNSTINGWVGDFGTRNMYPGRG